MSSWSSCWSGGGAEQEQEVQPVPVRLGLGRRRGRGRGQGRRRWRVRRRGRGGLCPRRRTDWSLPRSWTCACGRGLHSSTFQLNLSALYGIGCSRRGCVARIKGVLGGV